MCFSSSEGANTKSISPSKNIISWVTVMYISLMVKKLIMLYGSQYHGQMYFCVAILLSRHYLADSVLQKRLIFCKCVPCSTRKINI